MKLKTPINLASKKGLKKKIALQRGQRIKLARSITSFSRKDMFLRHNINTNTLHAWESGTNCLSERNALKLSEAFTKEGLSISQEWLLHGEDPNPEKHLDLMNALEIRGELNFFKEIHFFKKNNLNAISTMVSDEALSPIFCHGDYVGGINLLGANIKSLVGEFCIVTTSDNHLLTRKIVKHQSNNIYMIGSINPYANLQSPDYYSCPIKAAAKITRHWCLDRIHKVSHPSMSSKKTKS